MKTAVYVTLCVMLALLVAIALTSCRLDPSKRPPCAPSSWPDPCAAAPHDAGRG